MIDETRPRAYEDDTYPWNVRRLSRIPCAGEEPDAEVKKIKESGIFVVHGMGTQEWTQTSAMLRSSVEDAFEAINRWQRSQAEVDRRLSETLNAPPFIYGGYWANYADLEATFPEDWAVFNERERNFFGRLWKLRTVSVMRTFTWFWRQLWALRSSRVRREVGPWVYWFIYWPLQVNALVALLFALVMRPRLVTGYLADVRLYLDPRGVAERAIVQRIDRRVGESFLRMIGLDWHFRCLPPTELIEACGERLRFERVVWVAHSLGTVISYNVLSDLFERSQHFEQSGDQEQQEGAKRFRQALRRFVTLGSPLDKVAFLFPNRVLRPWPGTARASLLEASGDEVPSDAEDGSQRSDWWINYYHVFDPVSGTLESPVFRQPHTPINMHIRLGQVPGLAHVAYWTDRAVLRFILSRAFGRECLQDAKLKPRPRGALRLYAAIGHVVWTLICVGGLAVVVFFGPDLLRWLISMAKDFVVGA